MFNSLKTIALNLIIFAALLFVIEILLNIYQHFTIVHAGKDIVNCLDRSQVPAFKSSCNGVNALGARGQEIQSFKQAKAPGSTILVLGESVAYGWGADYDKTWSEDINKMDLEPSALLLNYGIPSTTIRDAAHYYDKLRKVIDHDAIIIFTGWNDLYSSLYNKNFGRLFSYSHIARKIYDLIIRKSGRYIVNEANVDVIQEFQENYEQLVMAATENDKSVYVITLPSYLEDTFSWSDYNMQIAGNLGSHASVGAIRAGFKAINTIIRNISKKHQNVCLIDLDQAFRSYPDKKKFFVGEVVHMNAEGQQWIANQFAHQSKTCTFSESR